MGPNKASWRNRHDLWDTERKRTLGEKEKDRTAREADLNALGAEPEAPPLPIVVTPDPTVEGLVKNMASLRPSLGLFSDEGGAFLGGVGMNPENRLKTIATLSAFWDGSPVSRLRAGDGASLFLGRRLSVHLMAQPVAASTLLADPVANGQGILARFLTAEPESAIGTRTRLELAPQRATPRWRALRRGSASCCAGRCRFGPTAGWTLGCCPCPPRPAKWHGRSILKPRRHRPRAARLPRSGPSRARRPSTPVGLPR